MSSTDTLDNESNDSDEYRRNTNDSRICSSSIGSDDFSQFSNESNDDERNRILGHYDVHVPPGSSSDSSHSRKSSSSERSNICSIDGTASINSNCSIDGNVDNNQEIVNNTDENKTEVDNNQDTIINDDDNKTEVGISFPSISSNSSSSISDLILETNQFLYNEDRMNEFDQFDYKEYDDNVQQNWNLEENESFPVLEVSLPTPNVQLIIQPVPKVVYLDEIIKIDNDSMSLLSNFLKDERTKQILEKTSELNTSFLMSRESLYRLFGFDNKWTCGEVIDQFGKFFTKYMNQNCTDERKFRHVQVYTQHFYSQLTANDSL